MERRPCTQCKTTDPAEFWKGQRLCKTCDKAYKLANREKYLDLWRHNAAQWAAANPEKARQKYTDYKARLKAAPGQLTPRLVAMVYEIHGHQCLKCAATKDLTIDHVLPLTLGGSNCLDNLQPLCRACNGGKGGRFGDYRSLAIPGRYRVEEAAIELGIAV